MRGRLVATAAAVLAAAAFGPAGAPAQEHHPMPPAVQAVSIGFITYAPAHLDVLVGAPVTWTNDSVRKHTVTADDDSFDAGELFGGDHYTHVFTSVGDVAYHCRVHAGMAGTLGVRELLLDAPGQAAAPGRRYPVSGRAALPDGTAVTIEADTGRGFAPTATASVGPDGAFATTVTPTVTGRLRAVAAGATSPEVPLTVLDHALGLSVRRAGRRLVLTGAATPAAPGATVVLQLDLREHFGWWPVRRLRLDRRSRATVLLAPLHRRVRARMVLTLEDGATPLAVSAVRTLGPAPRQRAGLRW